MLQWNWNAEFKDNVMEMAKELFGCVDVLTEDVPDNIKVPRFFD